MKMRLTGVALLLTALVACAGEEEAPDMAMEEMPTEEMAMGDMAAVQCAPMVDRMAIDGRVSPYDSTVVNIGGQDAKVCYNRPSVRGRAIFGSDIVPYDTIWRTGANEPTTIHLPFPAQIAGMRVDPGSYTLYTVPREDGDWTVIVNRSITQWGIESAYSPDVRSQEVGRAEVPAETTTETTELFTIESEPAGANAANLVLEWENKRVTIPIQRV